MKLLRDSARLFSDVSVSERESCGTPLICRPCSLSIGEVSKSVFATSELSFRNMATSLAGSSRINLKVSWAVCGRSGSVDVFLPCLAAASPSRSSISSSDSENRNASLPALVATSGWLPLPRKPRRTTSPCVGPGFLRLVLVFSAFGITANGGGVGDGRNLGSTFSKPGERGGASGSESDNSDIR